MWIIFQAFARIWAWISTRLFVKKNAQTAESDIEKVAGSGEDPRMQATRARARNRFEEREMAMFQNDLQSLYQREVAMLQRNTFHSSRKYHGLRRGTVGSIENDPYRVAPPQRPKRAKQLRKHSAKYRLRQGDYVENWDCELSELYGKRSPPQPSTPSPLLSGFSPLVAGEDIREETYRFSGRWPTLPCTATVSTSRILRSPFLASSEPQSSKQSPFLAQFTDLTQTIMTDFKPIGYSTNALSAVTDTFWDAPAVMPAKPAPVFGASYNRCDGSDTLAASSSVGLIWSLPSFPNADPIYEARGEDELCREI